MPTELQLECGTENGVRYTRVQISPRHTARLIEHFRGAFAESFEVELDAGSWEDGDYDLITIHGSDAEMAVHSFRIQ